MKLYWLSGRDRVGPQGETETVVVPKVAKKDPTPTRDR